MTWTPSVCSDRFIVVAVAQLVDCLEGLPVQEASYLAGWRENCCHLVGAFQFATSLAFAFRASPEVADLCLLISN